MKQVFNTLPWIAPKEYDEIKKIYYTLGSTINIKKNTVLKFPGDENKLFYIKKGVCFAYINTNDSKQLMIGVLLPERAVGDMTVVSGERVNMTIIAKHDAQILAVSPDRFREKVMIDPALVMLMAKTILSKRNSQMEGLIANLTMPLADRLRAFFVSITESCTTSIHDGYIKLPIKFSNEDLATITASTRVSVSRVLSHWVELGLIKKDTSNNKFISLFLLENTQNWSNG